MHDPKIAELKETLLENGGKQAEHMFKMFPLNI